MVDISRIEDLYRENRRRLLTFISRITQAPDYAEDILHDSFERILLYMARYDLKEVNLRAFVFKTARNCSINWLKRNSRIHLPIEVVDEHPHYQMVHERIESPPLTEIMVPYLAGVGEGCRTVFFMKNISALSTSQIAERLGVSERTVRRRVRRVNQFLKTNYALSDFSDVA